MLEIANPQVFWDKVDMTPNATFCWIWRGGLQQNGYGAVSLSRTNKPRGQRYLAHRAVYEHLIGHIPKDLQLDHKCRNRACVNPAHLEAVTCRENVLRGEGVAAINARKKRCACGAEYSRNKTQRYCVQCNSERSKRYYRQVIKPKLAAQLDGMKEAAHG